MIDWITAILRCKHDPSKLVSGMVMSFDSQGNNEWVINKQVTVEGPIPQKFRLNHILILKYGFQAIQQNFYRVIIFLELTIFVI